jgi:hypothetical protein
MANIHNPERIEGESFAAYKARRAASNKVGRDMRRNPNHGLVGSRESYRDSMRQSGAMGQRTRASDALMAAWASKRITKAAHRDEHGAYTCVGPVYEVYGMNPDEGREHVIGAGKESDGTAFYSARRKWLAGVSAQRGY